MDKPKRLYRGVKLSHKLFQEVPLYGVDLVPHYEALIDSQGRKTVTDGNEYGVYMTDNRSMAQDAYAKVSLGDGSCLRPDLQLRINGAIDWLRVPAVGVLYEIDTHNVNVHKPWLTDNLHGVYNNGYKGDEWVAERIPAQCYSVVELTVGPDLLHVAEKVDATNIVFAEKRAREIVKERKARLEVFGKKLEKLPAAKLYQISGEDILLFRALFGKDGVHYENSRDLVPESGKDYARFLLAKVYDVSRDNLDYPILKYIYSLQRKLVDGDTVDKLRGMILDDMGAIDVKRAAFIARKQAAGESYSTTYFDKLKETYSKVLEVLEDKVYGNCLGSVLESAYDRAGGKTTVGMDLDFTLN